MRKMIIGILLLSLLISVCGYAYAMDIAPAYVTYSVEGYENFLSHWEPTNLRCGFVLLSELSMFGRMESFCTYRSDLRTYSYEFTLSQTTGGYYGHLGLDVEHNEQQRYQDFTVLDMSCVEDSVDKLKPEYQEAYYVLQREEISYVFYYGDLEHIEWQNGDILFSLHGYSSSEQPHFTMAYYIGTIIEKLLSINEEEFQEAKAQLLTIGSNRQHPYSDKWNWGKEGHWHECKCGAKEEVFAHIDEDQNYKCDICPYNIPKNASNSPVIKPAQTDDTATQPTAKPTTPATEPTPAAQEPAPSATGMWIGIGAACAIVVAAVVVILLRKKKSA